MANGGHIVHWRKKFKRQKKSVSPSFTWSVPKCLALGQNLACRAKKLIFRFLGLRGSIKTQKTFNCVYTAQRFFLEFFFFINL